MTIANRRRLRIAIAGVLWSSLAAYLAYVAVYIRADDSPRAIIATVLVVVAACALYFLPAFVAGFTRHPYTAGIVALNVLAGWTFVGWVAAFVWSVSKPAATKGEK